MQYIYLEVACLNVYLSCSVVEYLLLRCHSSFLVSLDVIRCPSNKTAVSKTSKPPEHFHACLKGKAIDEIMDDGRIPGDQEGAGGLDSAFWA